MWLRQRMDVCAWALLSIAMVAFAGDDTARYVKQVIESRSDVAPGLARATPFLGPCPKSANPPGRYRRLPRPDDVVPAAKC